MNAGHGDSGDSGDSGDIQTGKNAAHGGRRVGVRASGGVAGVVGVEVLTISVRGQVAAQL